MLFLFPLFSVSLSLSLVAGQKLRNLISLSLSFFLSLLSLNRATANESYLRAANDHFVAYLYQEGGGRSLAFTPNNYFWAANVLLATTTDGGTFHERSRFFLRQWACAEGVEVRYTPRGRALVGSAPTLGASAASAFLAAAYGDKIKVRLFFFFIIFFVFSLLGLSKSRKKVEKRNTQNPFPPSFSSPSLLIQ